MSSLQALTVDQMREVDRIMVDEIGVSIIMMMENASRNTAVLTRKMLGGSVRDKKVTILCGKGNNGGDGLGAARHLINFGANVTCILSEKKESLRKNAMIQLHVLENINANVIFFSDENPNKIKELTDGSDVIIDALLGYNLKGDPKEPIATLIKLANKSNTPILAVDIPSGLDGNTGKSSEPTIKASSTITLAMPKTGLLEKSANKYVGKLHIADLSVPDEVYKRIGIRAPSIFEHDEVVEFKKSALVNPPMR